MVFLVVLQVLDVLTTMHGLGMGKQEGNPVGQALLQTPGWLGIILAKVLATSVVYVGARLLWNGSAMNRLQARVGLQLGCCFMLAIVSWNAWVGLMRYG